MFKEMVEIGILFDFYGKLLSDSQYNVVELYYIYDYSLSEIGEELGISRQGVYDTLKRAESNLYEFEDRLKLVKKFKSICDEVNIILEYVKMIVNEGRDLSNDSIVNNAKAIEKVAKKIIDNSQEVV